jgi:exo-1,4-beta-D-glucosaminidase
MQNSATPIAQNLRDHPSVFSFQWSDQPPLAKQESVTLTAFAQQDFDQPVISSAEYNTSPKLGASGEKEGPYDWVPPNYWYDTTHSDSGDSSQTNAGGSWGYDSEQSAGDTIPTMDSLNRFMSPGDLSSLWQNPDANQYHLNYEKSCSLNYTFGTACKFDAAMTARYGKPSSQPRPVRRGSPGPGLRGRPCPVRGVHRPCGQHPAAVHRDDLLADEQGHAERL